MARHERQLSNFGLFGLLVLFVLGGLGLGRVEIPKIPVDLVKLVFLPHFEGESGNLVEVSLHPDVVYHPG